MVGWFLSDSMILISEIDARKLMELDNFVLQNIVMDLTCYVLLLRFIVLYKWRVQVTCYMACASHSILYVYFIFYTDME